MSRIEAKQYVKETTVAIEMGFMDSGDILSIVLHFIMCSDILNGACHSILTTARG